MNEMMGSESSKKLKNMKGVFTSITNEEKDDILSKHKTLYDGYAVRNETQNTQPLYVQDSSL